MKNAYCLQDSVLRVEWMPSDQGVRVHVTDCRTGACWTAAASARLEVLDRGLQRTEVVGSPPDEIVRDDDGAVSCRFRSNFYGMTVIVRFRIEQGELVVHIPSDRIVESNPEVGLLEGIDILPGLLSVGPQTFGHLVLPLQTGVLCWPDRHQRLQDRFLIYGEQKRWEDLPLLPCCGAVREKDQAALMAIAASGDCDAECRVGLDGHGGGTTGFAMRYRYTPIDPVDPIDRVVRFVPLQGVDAGYAGMGRRMFRHILHTAGRGTLAERAARNPQIRYAATSYTVKPFHAHKKIGPIDGTGEYNVWATFDQTAEQLTFLKRHGIDKVWTQCTGWNPDGHDGCWPTRFPIDERLGGEAGFRRMVETGKALGYMMCVHDNYLDHYMRSADWDPDLCCGNLYGQPLKQGIWSGGQMYRGWGLALPDSRLRDQLLRMKNLGVDGVYYIDAMGMPLEVSYNPRHGARRYRRACAEGQARILKTAEELFGGSASEMGFLYLAAHTDSIATPMYPGLIIRQRELADRQVPLWPMALKGLICYESSQIHRYAIEMSGKWPSLAGHLLELAEIGIKPRAETSYVVAAWSGYPVEANIVAMRAANDLMLKRLESTCLAALEDHAFLDDGSDFSKRITRSRYSDGTEVVCDYEHTRLEINGEPYPLPLDYVKRPKAPVGTRPESDL